jgi:hypothetical protein
MKNAPIIDLSLVTPRQMMLDKGPAMGAVHIVWFRLLRPSLVGTVWAAICVYTYRYLLPFNQAEMPVEQLFFYLTGITGIASAFVLWMVGSRVVHPFMYRSRMSKMLRRAAEISVSPGPFVAAARTRLDRSPRILVASHDSTGAIRTITPSAVEPHSQILLYTAQWKVPVSAGPRRHQETAARVPDTDGGSVAAG